MSALLPKLDDRRWTDLVEEGRALIPVYSPEWTDHNVHDPGITVLELLAWLAETDIFRVDRVPDRNRRKFLSLVGIRPAPPRAARAVLRIGISAGNPIVLPAGVEFTTRSARAVPFRSIEALTLVPGKIDAVQWEDASGFHDVTQAWLNGEAFLPFGPAPEPGAVFYVGLTDPLPVGVPATLFFSSPEAAPVSKSARALARRNKCASRSAGLRRTPAHVRGSLPFRSRTRTSGWSCATTRFAPYGSSLPRRTDAGSPSTRREARSRTRRAHSLWMEPCASASRSPWSR